MKAGAYIKYTGVCYHRCTMECIVLGDYVYLSRVEVSISLRRLVVCHYTFLKTGKHFIVLGAR
jgi:hypothetical protein